MNKIGSFKIYWAPYRATLLLSFDQFPRFFSSIWTKKYWILIRRWWNYSKHLGWKHPIVFQYIILCELYRLGKILWHFDEDFMKLDIDICQRIENKQNESVIIDYKCRTYLSDIELTFSILYAWKLNGILKPDITLCGNKMFSISSVMQIKCKITILIGMVRWAEPSASALNIRHPHVYRTPFPNTTFRIVYTMSFNRPDFVAADDKHYIISVMRFISLSSLITLPRLIINNTFVWNRYHSELRKTIMKFRQCPCSSI